MLSLEKADKSKELLAKILADTLLKEETFQALLSTAGMNDRDFSFALETILRYSIYNCEAIEEKSFEFAWLKPHLGDYEAPIYSLRMTPLRACSIMKVTIYLHESEQSDEKRRSKDFV